MCWKDKVFDVYKINYEKIFRIIYPAKGNTGFPEKNLSVNFVKAYERIYSDAIIWYELQFGERNNNHIDVIVVDKKNKRLLLIESKRFNNPSQKIPKIREDIERIKKVKDELLNDSDKRISDVKSYTFYGIVLADVWMETKTKENIYEEFREETFIKNKYEDILLKNLYYNTKDFVENKDFINSNIRENYKLVSFVWEL